MSDKENRRKCFKCGSSPAEDGVKLFRFPNPGSRNLFRCESWARYVFSNRNCTFEIQKKLYSEHRMLCGRHFKDIDFIDGDKKLLSRSAIPSPAIVPESVGDESSEEIESVHCEESQNDKMLASPLTLNPDASTPDLDSPNASATDLYFDVVLKDMKDKKRPMTNMEDNINECYEFLMALAKPLSKLSEQRRHECMHQIAYIVMDNTREQQQ
ncbi:uncharacterized protein LOC121735986 isoform X2 [Aricia agestis]|uniref:uncharacterized protein LOC121735986 isoform X2 n=1 Tax=Aricia agestis TaxID=91739 RepID=UPI001C20C14F|nr:uncharacterized protein LOC121735986 isoform X2 [Aricia agestis]